MQLFENFDVTSLFVFSAEEVFPVNDNQHFCIEITPLSSLDGVYLVIKQASRRRILDASLIIEAYWEHFEALFSKRFSMARHNLPYLKPWVTRFPNNTLAAIVHSPQPYSFAYLRDLINNVAEASSGIDHLRIIVPNVIRAIDDAALESLEFRIWD
jgi:hypothetical protein